VTSNIEACIVVSAMFLGGAYFSFSG